MKRWVLYVDGEEPSYFDEEDLARWAFASRVRPVGAAHDLPQRRATIEALQVGEECDVAEGKVQRLDDERKEVCDAVGCYELFTTFKNETRCLRHRYREGMRGE